ncbi:unnamed protein product [Didymodactylos carnosus]|uniref:Uncharacterized protein n=1 Tax=Didymodactylos carnosus TaxID=1234261 RepID=A0A813Y8F1_9BILA|nr:unnamed protein product [Didymodactylos carnosus]CAF3666834.1 unnamed protein product [Didymodactylos carnosus]
MYPYLTPRKSEYPPVTVPQNAVDPRFSQIINRASFMPPLQQSMTRVSSIDPRFNPSTSQFARTDAWGTGALPPKSGMNNFAPMTEEKPESAFAKTCSKMSSSKMLFLLIGLIICGIPLAVMTTLWVSSRSSSSITGTTTTGYSSSSASLSTQCYAYSSLTDQYRVLANGYTCNTGSYDTSLTAGWYRISGLAGTQLIMTSPSSTCTCGISYPGWFNGSLPTSAGTLTTGNVCFFTGSTCGFSLSPISVINCNGYYVWYLLPTTSSSYRYCTQA